MLPVGTIAANYIHISFLKQAMNLVASEYHLDCQNVYFDFHSTKS